MKKMLVTLLVILTICTGCSTTWVSTFDSILAAAAPALIDILQIVAVATGHPFNATLAAKINTDAADLKTLAADFSANTNTNTCQLLQASLTTYQNDIALVEQIAQVSDPATQQKIVLLSGLVISVVNSAIAVIPQCQAPAATLKKFGATPPMGMRTFVGSYNKYLTEKTGNAGVDALTPTLKLHKHSAFARAATFGYLK